MVTVVRSVKFVPIMVIYVPPNGDPVMGVILVTVVI